MLETKGASHSLVAKVHACMCMRDNAIQERYMMSVAEVSAQLRNVCVHPRVRRTATRLIKCRLSDTESARPVIYGRVRAVTASLYAARLLPGTGMQILVCAHIETNSHSIDVWG